MTGWHNRAIDYFQRLKRKRAKAFYRCGKCRRRKVLSKELWEYQKPPKCCGGVHWTIDMNRYKEWKEKTGMYAVCTCPQGMIWDAPHRPGSIVFCKHSKATAEEIGEWVEANQYR